MQIIATAADKNKHNGKKIVHVCTCACMRERKKEPGHDAIFLMCTAPETKVLHLLELVKEKRVEF